MGLISYICNIGKGEQRVSYWFDIFPLKSARSVAIGDNSYTHTSLICTYTTT